MKVCKIRPIVRVCSACVDYAEKCGALPDCANCGCEKEYEILDMRFSFWNNYVVILKDGKIEKVDTSRVYGVRDTEGTE